MADLSCEGPPTLPDPADKRDLDPFEARLKAAKARATPEPRQVAISALAKGTRHAFEIAATTIVGAGIGWMLDSALGTRPWLFLLFLLLGIMAGFWNLMKAVNVEVADVRREAEARDKDRDSQV
jgi:ATP synthase protein I